MKRLLTLDVGDWSNDGHGRHEKILVGLKADDSSDSAIRESVQKAVSETEIDINSLFRFYEEDSLDKDSFERLIEAGLNIEALPSTDGVETPVFWVEEPFSIGSENEAKAYPLVDLIMFYVVFDLKNFSWKEIKPPNLIGGRVSILNESSDLFGYGLFH